MKRIAYIDRARALGMFLVYYGHLVQKVVAVKGNAVFADQWRVIYAFHMPLFFFLAGIFWKPSADFLGTLKSKLKTRFIPWIFFTLLLLPLWLALDPAGFWERLLTFSYLTGNPKLNIVTWFLICLMVAELLAALVGKFLKVTPFRLVLYSSGFFFIGYYGFVRNPASVTEWIGVRPDIWYIDDAFMAMPFYFAGYLLRDVILWLEDRRGWLVGVLIAALTGYGVIRTYNLNVEEKFWGVLMISSKYGNAYYFLLTAFLGIFFVIAVSRALHFDIPALNFVGRNTIIYLGLNGLCQHFLNDVIVENFHPPMHSHLDVFLYTSAVCVLTLTLFVPLVLALRRWLPELVGVPWTPTSLLPPVDTWHERGAGGWLVLQMKKHIFN